jgi:hypothetical protein
MGEVNTDFCACGHALVTHASDGRACAACECKQFITPAVAQLQILSSIANSLEQLVMHLADWKAAWWTTVQNEQKDRPNIVRLN